MIRLRAFVIGLGVVAACVTFSLVLGAATERLNPDQAQNFTRACRFAGAANYQYTTATGSATGSTQALSAAQVYRMQCTQDVRWSQRPSGSTGVASSTTPYLKADRELYFWSRASDYMSVLAISAAGTCDVTECQ